MTTMRQSPPDTAEGDLQDEQCRLSSMRWNPGDRREREEELPSRSLPHIFPPGSLLEVSHGLQRWLSIKTLLRAALIEPRHFPLAKNANTVSGRSHALSPGPARSDATQTATRGSP